MKVRHLTIRNFRSIRKLSWHPGPGMNCLIGPGDSGKSTVLDALDLLLTARRAASFSDADFNALDVDNSIEISATLGDLDDDLKSLETYGNYLRGYDIETRTVLDEPESASEVALTLVLTVNADLEPLWTLTSDRSGETSPRYLTWSDRQRLSPIKLGAHAQHHFAWRRGSVLSKLGDEKADASEALAAAAREARAAFGDLGGEQLGETLGIVKRTAEALGVSLNGDPKVMLDPQSISFGSGSISVHDGGGVPLGNLGAGSSRLLVAGLQREAAAENSSVALVDELEFGLEPHRLIRLIGSLGAKDDEPTLQVFATTHSPVAIRELACSQIGVLRHDKEMHYVVGVPDDCQGTLRICPEAFLATSVIVCEGATEVGFLRGFDRWRVKHGRESLNAKGVALVDAGGYSKIYGRAHPLGRLGYRVAVLRDDDAKPNADDEAAFEELGTVFKWRDDQSIEDELFRSLDDEHVLSLLTRAAELHGQQLIDDQFRSASNGALTVEECKLGLDALARDFLAKAANKGSWFKRIDWMEDATFDIVGPGLKTADQAFRDKIRLLRDWLDHARR